MPHASMKHLISALLTGVQLAVCSAWCAAEPVYFVQITGTHIGIER